MSLIDEKAVILLSADARLWVSTLKVDELSNLLESFFNISTIRPDTKFDHITKASANIGLDGESTVRKILQKRYKLVTTAKTGKCGDLIIMINGFKILIEVKKYTTTVPSTELAKFYRDIEANSSVNAGLMISLTSRIVGTFKSVDRREIFVTGSKTPVTLLCLNGLSSTVSEELLFCVIDLLQSELECCNNIGDEIVSAVDKISDQLDAMSGCRIIVSEAQTIINKQLNKVTKEIMKSELIISNCVKSIKQKITKEEFKTPTDDELNQLISTTSADKSLMIKTVLKETDLEYQIDIKKKTIRSDKVSIRILSGSVKVGITCKLLNVIYHLENLPDAWNKYSYASGVLVINLEEISIQHIINIVKQF
jgi:hypothetical protein